MKDIEIARNAKMKDIYEMGKSLDIEDALIPYGKYKAKINLNYLKDRPMKGKLILVTAMSPTPMGEGKTTVTVGLGDGLHRLGHKTVIALREPSLGPVFGMKGGACGGGYAQVLPMEEINLHFTGDFHSITSANNLLAAMLDNHIYHGNELNIDLNNIRLKRCLDVNDRQLRKIRDGLGSHYDGVEREDGFDITVASEVMAVFCLAKDLDDLKERLGRVIVAYTPELEPIFAKDLQATGAMVALLKDSFSPNLVQTIEHTPAIIHGGPFANIAHGCNSYIGTKTALQLGDYCITEAGFGADLGAEKFFDIKCRTHDLNPSAVVMVATIKALKMNGGIAKDNLNEENVEAIIKGFDNLKQHIQNMRTIYQMPVVVAINHFPTDTDNEIKTVIDCCAAIGVEAFDTCVWEKGGEGALSLARKVIELCEQKNDLTYAYDLEMSIEDKIKTIVQKVYHGKEVVFSEEALNQIHFFEKKGYGNLPICMAKTQYSFSDNPTLLGAPKDFELQVRQVKLSAGAGFVVVLTGTILTMPGLPALPAACQIDVDSQGQIIGLF